MGTREGNMMKGSNHWIAACLCACGLLVVNQTASAQSHRQAPLPNPMANPLVRTQVIPNDNALAVAHQAGTPDYVLMLSRQGDVQIARIDSPTTHTLICTGAGYPKKTQNGFAFPLIQYAKVIPLPGGTRPGGLFLVITEASLLAASVARPANNTNNGTHAQLWDGCDPIGGPTQGLVPMLGVAGAENFHVQAEVVTVTGGLSAENRVVIASRARLPGDTGGVDNRGGVIQVISYQNTMTAPKIVAALTGNGRSIAIPTAWRAQGAPTSTTAVSGKITGLRRVDSNGNVIIRQTMNSGSNEFNAMYAQDIGTGNWTFYRFTDAGVIDVIPDPKSGILTVVRNASPNTEIAWLYLQADLTDTSALAVPLSRMFANSWTAWTGPNVPYNQTVSLTSDVAREARVAYNHSDPRSQAVFPNGVPHAAFTATATAVVGRYTYGATCWNEIGPEAWLNPLDPLYRAPIFNPSQPALCENNPDYPNAAMSQTDDGKHDPVRVQVVAEMRDTVTVHNADPRHIPLLPPNNIFEITLYQP